MPIEEGTAVDFFAGVGLARMGLEQAGWRVTFSNDISAKKYEMYRGHWGNDPHYLVRDIFELSSDDVPAAELAWASFPCIDLSLAGNRNGLNGKHSGAFWGLHKILAAKHKDERPYLVVLENVTGMLTSHGGADLEILVACLNDLAYTVDLLAVDAAKFVPQSRPRLFVIGTRAPYGMSSRIGELGGARPKAVVDFMHKRPQLNWGSIPIGPLPSRAGNFSDIVEWFPPDADVWWTDEARDRLVSQMSDRHSKLVTQLIDQEKISFVTVYRRIRSSGYMAEVRFDGLAGCLRTPTGGSSKQFLLQLGKGHISARNMTAIEYARLQGAPHYRIQVPYNQALFGFGDGVCVPAVEWVAREYLNKVRIEAQAALHG